VYHGIYALTEFFHSFQVQQVAGDDFSELLEGFGVLVHFLHHEAHFVFRVGVFRKVGADITGSTGDENATAHRLVCFGQSAGAGRGV
jgi:hypothetical protein